jgi:hypothetical protein
LNTANVIAIVAAVVASLRLFVAALQYLDNRRRKRSEREILAQREERLRTAEMAAVMAARTADLIVQRGKENKVDRSALTDFARILRGDLVVLAKHLSDEVSEIPPTADSESLDSARRQTKGTTIPERREAPDSSGEQTPPP